MTYTLLYFFIFLLLVTGVLMFKNSLTFKHTVRALDFMSDQPDSLALNTKNPTAVAYYRNFLHPLKWTYRSMFPRLYELENKQGAT